MRANRFVQAIEIDGAVLFSDRNIITHLILKLLRWLELVEQRRRLLQLGDRMLKDIGVSRADAERESQRPFWDDPL